MTDQRFVAAWRMHRAYLVDLAYRMLGDVGGAEDVVQEAFARLAAADGVEDDRGWLTVVTSRLCLDQIRSARVRRESALDAVVADAVAPVAGLPPTDPADRVTLDDEVRAALLVVLRRLTPAERVAFVLHDVFRMPFESIAETLGRPVATCRQLARRARQRIAAAGPPGRPPAEPEHRAVTEEFLAACGNGDLDGLLALLHPDVWGTADIGTGITQVSRGPAPVAANLLRFFGPGTTLVTHPAGGPTILAFVAGQPFASLTLTIADGQILQLRSVVERPR